MPSLFSKRLLPILQLTRMALVFTAISNSVCAMLLLAKTYPTKGGSPWDLLTAWNLAAVVVMSIGMYGFGMSLNDIIDRRRDAQISPGRPLPSGRIGVRAAHIICLMMAFLAMTGAVAYAWNTSMWPMTIVYAAATLVLIAFYDFAGKYLVAPGILALGLIRFFHAVVAAPQIPLFWHPLLLMNHVVVLSAVCYRLEEKRPTMTRGHWWAVILGLLAADLLCVAAVWWRRFPRSGSTLEALALSPGLLYPLAALVGFLVAAGVVVRRSSDPRSAGQTLMLLGLLWLIVYDVAIVAGCVNLTAAVVQAMLLPVAYLAVQAMRWWGRLVAISQPPRYMRAR
ncbi:MAG: UbiA family prenyltransferase [Phycisphaerae bacterium]|nr:UbiA family prenyltransferase [Phycisphaerae bacterium]MDW8261265.1 UbiA family prenyltransferase [Phycisphaerales bacterium]